MGLDPLVPDQDYCVYCHAPAAGVCAECGALCCGDCVELVMGWTVRRAVCRSCHEDRDVSPSTGTKTWLAVALFAGLALVALFWD